MQEDFLHYLWKYKKFAFAKAQTTSQQPISLVSVGQHNHGEGPDFFNSKLRIDDQLWAGNVEIHLKSSDWYAHNHEADTAYDSVILHVVWEHDVEVYRSDNSPIPTLELQNYVSEKSLENYQELFAHQSAKWINCEEHLCEVPEMVQTNWLERLYFERLARKTENILELLEASQGDWENVLFQMMARNFGTKVNGEAFQSLASSINFSVVRKCSSEPFRLEALLMGQAAILPQESFDSYPLQLIAEYEFVVHKFKLQNRGVLPVQFFKLRPDNFPTIRLSQLAQLYHVHQNLFQMLMSTSSISDFYDIFKVQASPFWDNHYSFTSNHKKKPKKVTKRFVDLLLINTIIPIKFAYGKQQGKEVEDEVLELISAIKPESNSIIKKFNSLRENASSAQDTQALLEMYTNYCSPNKCLQCANGNWLMGR